MTYLAITNRSGQWVYVCSGQHPQEVYQHAITILEAQEYGMGEEIVALSPAIERQLATLRVIPEEVAQETYQVQYGPVYAEE